MTGSSTECGEDGNELKFPDEIQVWRTLPKIQCGSWAITRYPEETETYIRKDLVLELLSDPNAVHLNILKGTIAKPTIDQILHIYPELSKEPEYITLNYVKRYPNSKKTKSWEDKLVQIETEHGVWKPNGYGYTVVGSETAWILSFKEAVKCVWHTGPEKKARFILVK